MHIFNYPSGSSDLFEFLAPDLPGLPTVPPELTAARHRDDPTMGYVASSEPEVARTLYGLARLTQARRIVEVGVWQGYTTQFLAAALAPNGGDLHLVDFSESAITDAATLAGRYSNVAIHRHLGMSDAPATLAAVPNGCDLIFLDADHTEAGVAAELECWAPKLRPGGLIAVHDAVNIPGVCAAVNRFVAAGRSSITLATGRRSGLMIARAPR
ncbi:MAG: O-methyltransferase, partial [Gemmataceae bacterium]